MPLDYPNLEEIQATITAEFRTQLPQVDPTVYGSWSRAFRDGDAAAHLAFYGRIQDAVKQSFPTTATGSEFLDNRWGTWFSIPRNPAVGSRGTISQQGTVATSIPVGTKYRGNNAKLYSVTQVGTIAANSGTISTLTRIGTTATGKTTANHGFGNNQTVTIAGAAQTEYNGTFNITVISENEFQYAVSGSPTTPATGTITYSDDYAVISVQADDTGQETNLDTGATLSLVTPIVGITVAAVVTFDGLSGGASVETDDEYRRRIILLLSARAGVFTNAQVELAALSITGNTRAFVINPELSVCPVTPGDPPVPGQVVIYILRDNDPSIIPSQTLLDETKAAIIAQGKLPANTYSGDVFVLAPDLVTVNFDFTSLVPNTPTMQIAVRNQLEAFFQDQVNFGVDVQEASYLGAIQNTQDLTTGAFLDSFSLSTPTGNISVTTGEIATLGTVTFSI